MSRETWYAVVDSQGELVSTGTVVAEPKALKENGLSKLKLDGPPDHAAQEWDSTKRRFVDRPEPEAPTPDDAQAALADARAALARLEGAVGAS